LHLTGYFLERDIFKPRGQAICDQRQKFVDAIRMRAQL
jgi:hypothetical protein